jgi:hypothetical protein
MSTVDTEAALWEWERKRLELLGAEDARTHAKYVEATGDAIAPSEYLALRALWRAHGGKFHGPNVETGTMPEAKLMPLLRQLCAAGMLAVVATPPQASGS